MQTAFYKLDPFNAMPYVRTPWAGSYILEFKKKTYPDFKRVDPIGESWEVSTDPSFPSYVVGSSLPSSHLDKKLLSEVIAAHPMETLGVELAKHSQGGSCPLLLKWLHAHLPLSVQVHPPHHHPLLQEGECGKPESWFVFDVEEGGFVYLGFKEGLSKEKIMALMKEQRWEECLYKYSPKRFDYISVPTGLVHSVGPKVAIMEPQEVLPALSGKTWRLYDWDRRYDDKGRLDEKHGKPRPLHMEEALEALDWSLPREEELQKQFIVNLETVDECKPTVYNPFYLKVFKEKGCHHLPNLSSFLALSCAQGQANLIYPHQSLTLQAGESALVSAFALKESQIELLTDETFVTGFSVF
jgi:mannose-6-phosphate isomerase class I